MIEHVGTLLPTLLPFIFFFSLLVGSLAYLLIRLRGTHGHVKKENSIKHAALVTAGVTVVVCAFGLALACILVFEAFKVLWN